MSQAVPSGRRSVPIKYGSQVIYAETGERLLDAILAAGIDHRHVCGGFGFCTSCRVEIADDSTGLTSVSALERERLSNQAGTQRLACQARVVGPVAVFIPAPLPPRFSPFDDEEA